MQVEIITIGDEILIGQIVDTNSAWMAQQLNMRGFSVKQISSVSDNEQHILNALSEAATRASIVLITGGLGPTKDDITKKTLCKYFNTHLIFNDEVYSDIERLFKERGYQVSAVNRSQAELPANCMALRNAVGTAAGMWFNVDGVIYVSMPGVPYEMMHLMESSILPMLSQHFNAPHIIHHTLLTQGIGESILAEKIHDWEEALPEGIKLAYLPSVSAVRLRLSGSGEDKEKLKNEFDAQLLKLKALVGKYCYGENNDTLELVLGQLLGGQNKTLATAESCTGGQIASSITKVPGCSNYFKGGVIAYSNEVKVNQLNVSQSDLDAYGAVSKPVVESMAKGVIKLLDVDYAIATSGVAGPDGGSVEKPVGTVWIAVASRTEVYAQQFLFGKHRERNIQAATLTALNLMRRMLQGTLDVADYVVK
ncbi:MAG: competence/damage-inducible protein A [Bacteroidota bacterium]